MNGGHIYEKEVSSASFEEFILGTEKLLYGFIRVYIVTTSSEVNAELRQKQEHKNYAQSLMPTHVAREISLEWVNKNLKEELTEEGICGFPWNLTFLH